jgi:hypothetical protein
MGEPVILTKSHITQPQAIDSEKLQVKSADIGNMLATGQVESQNEVITVPYQTPTMVHETSNQVSNQNFKGYSIDDLKKYLKPSCRDIDNMTAEELINLAQTLLEKELELLETNKAYFSFETEEQKAIFEKLYPDEDGIEKAIIEACFDVGAVFHAIWKIEEEYPNALNIKTEELHEIYYRESISCAKWNQEYSNSPELQNLFKNLDGKSLEEKKSTIIKYLSKLYEANPDKNALLETFRNILVTIPEDDNETRKALLSAIILLSEEKHLDTFKDVLDFCRNDSEKAELIMSVDIDTMKNCAKNMFMYISEQYEKGGLVADKMIRIGITPDAIDKIRAALDVAKEGGEFVIDDELKNIFNVYKNYISGLETIDESLISRQDITPEDLETGRNIHDTAATIIGEAGMRDYWASWYEKLAQNPDLVQNIGQEQLDYILNKISNGNYQIVVEDILRGDGVQTPLNMPEGNSNNGEYGSNNYSSTSGNGSAQNPETGFFNVQPQSLLYNSQNNLAQLRQQIQDATHQNNTPQLIKPNQSIDNAIALGINLNKVVQQNIKENGVTGFVKEVLNSNIAMKCTYVRDKALNCFDSMGTGLRRLTFECIHKTSSAIVAARRMSSDELDNVQAQNIYVAQNIERIEEERKKQEDKV